MERIKRCIHCGTDNAASSLFCKACGINISRLPIEFVCPDTDLDTAITSDPAISDSQGGALPTADLDYARVCRCCGKVSVSNAPLCGGCGTELTSHDIVDTEGKISADYADMLNESGLSNYSITIVSGTKHIKSMRLSNGLSVFGRMQLDGFDDKVNYYRCISDIHCLISIYDDVVEITDISRNGTFLNNRKITSKTPVGDGISIDICSRECLSLTFRSGEP